MKTWWVGRVRVRPIQIKKHNRLNQLIYLWSIPFFFFHSDSLILIFYKRNLFRLLQLLEGQKCNLTIKSVEKEVLLFYTLQAIIGHFFPFFFFFFFTLIFATRWQVAVLKLTPLVHRFFSLSNNTSTINIHY